MSFRAGELTELITIREEVISPDGAGGESVIWQNLVKLYAHVRPLTGRESQGSDRTEATAGYLVVFRARTDITEKNKVVWRTREMNIRFVRDRKPRSLYLELECDRGVAI